MNSRPRLYSRRQILSEFLEVDVRLQRTALFGDAYSQIATLVEWHTRYVMLIKLVDKDSYTVAASLAKHAQILP